MSSTRIKIAHVLCADVGVSLRTSEDTTVQLIQESGNRYALYMPQLDASWSEDDPKSIWWWGTFCSLLDRIHPTTIHLETEAASSYSYDTPFGIVLSKVLSTNATHLRMGEYPGKDGWTLDKINQDVLAFSESELDITSNSAVAGAVLDAFDLLVKSGVYGTYLPSIDAVEVQDKLTAMSEDSELLRLSSTEHTSLDPLITITKKILAHLEFDPEEEEQKAEDQAQYNIVKGSDEQEEPGIDSNTIINYKDLNNCKNDSGSNSGSLTILYEDGDLYNSDSYLPYPTKETYLDTSNYACPYTTDKLSRQVSNLLKVRSQVRYQGGKRTGRLRNKSIARAATDMLYETPFKQKVDNEVLNTAVLLLVDTSGSMSGNRYMLASESAIHLSQCLSNLTIPNAVVGFTQDGAENHILIHKDFNDRCNLDKLYSNLQSGFMQYCGSNDDGVSLQWAYEHIRSHSSKRKIIIVLSDGQPACGCLLGDPATFLKQKAEEVEKAIDLFAIGIETSSVKHFYHNYKVLRDVNNLESTVLNVIKERII